MDGSSKWKKSWPTNPKQSSNVVEAGWEGAGLVGDRLIRIVCIYYHTPTDAEVEFLHMESGNKSVEPVQIVEATKDWEGV